MSYITLICSVCGNVFARKRKNQQYCSTKCQKNASRTCRRRENAKRSEDHYHRASWLLHDLTRMTKDKRTHLIQGLLEAASGGHAPTRNLLLDPRLLGADRGSMLGKLPKDRLNHDRPNIAKIVNRYCQDSYGCTVKDAILDDGKPAYRKFVGDPVRVLSG